MGKDQSKLTPQNLKELSQRTEFTHKEIKSFYKEFRKKSKTGSMKLDEFKKLYSTFFPAGDSSEFAQHTFRVFDANQDGILDFRELIVSLSVMQRGTSDERLKWAFNMYDVDGNGFITREELLGILRAIQKLSGKYDDDQLAKEMTDDIFKRVDKNSDGVLSLDEFIAGAEDDNDLADMLNNL
ncbi:neurocalcin homolog isoform X2 [Xenia sp. Carnegie-2017]|uniref:neurocalcin homolog isoform X2 n=1 Tax=Xenia sp. Carnegie-2017 TaxID=2897299 RepID=UPI001F040631|nr:neurocalcin homolog isoform X2 [Xenia sp. Carnegie-2017]